MPRIQDTPFHSSPRLLSLVFAASSLWPSLPVRLRITGSTLSSAVHSWSSFYALFRSLFCRIRTLKKKKNIVRYPRASTQGWNWKPSPSRRVPHPPLGKPVGALPRQRRCSPQLGAQPQQCHRQGHDQQRELLATSYACTTTDLEREEVGGRVAFEWECVCFTPE